MLTDFHVTSAYLSGTKRDFTFIYIFFFLLSAASNQLVKEKSESVEHREANGIISAVVL